MSRHGQPVRQSDRLPRPAHLRASQPTSIYARQPGSQPARAKRPSQRVQTCPPNTLRLRNIRLPLHFQVRDERASLASGGPRTRYHSGPRARLGQAPPHRARAVAHVLSRMFTGLVLSHEEAAQV
jgi:hypothetical protein